MNSWRRGFLVKRQVLPTSFDLAAVCKGNYLYLSNLQKINSLDVIDKPDVIKGASRTPKIFKTEFSVKTVKDFKL